MLQAQNLQTSRSDLTGNRNTGLGKNSGGKPSDTGSASFGDILASVGNSASAGSSAKADKSAKADRSVRDRSDSGSTGAEKTDGKTDDKSVKQGNEQEAAEKTSDAPQQKGDVSDGAAEEKAGAELVAMMNITALQAAETVVPVEIEQNAPIEQNTVVLQGAETDTAALTAEDLPVQAQDIHIDDAHAEMKAPELQQTEGRTVQVQSQAQDTGSAETQRNTAADTQPAAEGRADRQEEQPDTVRQTQRGDTRQQNAGQDNRGNSANTANSEMRSAGNESSGVTVSRENAVSRTAENQNVQRTEEPEETSVQPQSTAPAAAEEVTVKVSDGATLTQQLPKDVGSAVAAKISEGAQEFNITLNPENLGKIHIKLIIDNGRVTVMMHASEESTHRMLSMNSSVIKQIIEESTGQETHVEVQNADETADGSQGRGNGKQEQEEENQARHSENRNDSENDENGTISFIQQLRLGLVGEEAV